MKVTFILAEAALEPIPSSLRKDARIIKSCKKLGKKPDKCLLDKSLHYWAMDRLVDKEKRGRPDIAYHVMLDVTSSPLYKSGLLDFFVHTYNDYIIKVGNNVRPPRTYVRFEGLILDLFEKKIIKDINGNVLLELKRGKVKDILSEIGTSSAVGFDVNGELVTYENAAKQIISGQKVFIVGGFPTGDFSIETSSLFAKKFSLAREMLEADTVTCRLIYEIEKVLLLAK
jgi:rRNA small subunit pseudouridine methyltransferase Nep1